MNFGQNFVAKLLKISELDVDSDIAQLIRVLITRVDDYIFKFTYCDKWINKPCFVQLLQ